MRGTLVARALTAAATVATAVVGLAPGASAATCPGAENPCVYLPGGSYPLGNPVSAGEGVAPSSTVLLTHCDSNTGDCDDLRLNLPGLTFTSTPSTVLTLNVPGEGAGLSGITPVLYLGVPTVIGSANTSLGLTLTVTGTTFVLYDTGLSPRIRCSAPSTVPANPVLSGTYSSCSFTFTVTL
jgi:hypothetical protein